MQTPTIDQAMQLALQHYNSGQLQQAEQQCRWILARNADHADALNLLGIVAFRVGRADISLKLIARAVTLNPNSPEYHNNLGNVLLASGQYGPAAAAYRRSLAIKPGVAEIYNNLGNALSGVREYVQSLEAQQTSIRLNPNRPEPYSNTGTVLSELGKNDEAIAAYRAALALKPDFAEVHFNLSGCLLLKGDFETGWEEYEWRTKCVAVPDPREEFRRPVWDGGNLVGKTILLQAEQGLGDTLQFMRYVPMVAARGGRVLVECQPELIPVLKQLDVVSEWFPFGGSPPAFDIWARLLSLPCIFGTTLATIPAPTKLLKADASRSEQFRVQLDRLIRDQPRRPKVGLVWAGRPEHKNDHNRSMLLAQLLPLLESGAAVFFSLQKGPSASQIAALPGHVKILDLTPELHNFADTAALIDNLDLVIGVDTSVMHLAGAMGKPAWLLLPFVPDWRWLLDREESPWYPSLRLFRQKLIGDWSDVVQKITEALGVLCNP
jgi:Flp pilus assembly protein TadD